MKGRLGNKLVCKYEYDKFLRLSKELTNRFGFEWKIATQIADAVQRGIPIAIDAPDDSSTGQMDIWYYLRHLGADVTSLRAKDGRVTRLPNQNTACVYVWLGRPLTEQPDLDELGKMLEEKVSRKGVPKHE